MCVECSGGERIEAVEKYLHEKHASERGANVTKRGYVTRIMQGGGLCIMVPRFGLETAVKLEDAKAFSFVSS